MTMEGYREMEYRHNSLLFKLRQRLVVVTGRQQYERQVVLRLRQQ